MEDNDLRKIARRRVGSKRHAAVYVVVILFLGLINLFTFRHFPWFLFCAAGWGIGVLFHLLFAYGFMGDALNIEREFQRLKRKMSKTAEKPENKDEQYRRSDFEERVEHFASSARQVGQRADAYFQSTKEGRLVSCSVAIAWSIIVLIFFHFFRHYIAYYHYETINQVGRWVREPLLTENFHAVLPILTLTLMLSIVGNCILIIFDRYLLRQAISIILNVFGLATVLTFLFVFPFNFTVIPIPFAAHILSFVVALAFIGISIGFIVGIVVKAVRLTVTLVRGI
ncbi:2TM domain-containing protein [Candidatus Aerophobetes bacterium]|nr:2TM domain-containing protein [Candidatus Aerophobetes bacterium]